MSARSQLHVAPGQDVVVLVLDPRTCADVAAAVDFAAASGLMAERAEGEPTWAEAAGQMLAAATDAGAAAILTVMSEHPAGSRRHLTALKGGA